MATSDVAPFDYHGYYTHKLNLLSSSSFDKLSVNSIIDHLIAHHPSQAVINEVSEPFLQLFCQLIPLKEELLIAKVLHYIVITIDKRKIKLSSNCVVTLTEYLTSSLENCNEWLHADILYALSFVLNGSSNLIEKYLGKLIGDRGLLLRFCSADFKDVGVRIFALSCIGSIVAKCSGGAVLPLEYVKVCYSILLNAITESPPTNYDEIAKSKVILAALKGLPSALLSCKTVHVENLGLLLAALKFQTFTGYPGERNIQVTSLYPMPVGQYLPTITSNNVKSEGEVSLQTMTSQHQMKRSKKKRLNQKKRKNYKSPGKFGEPNTDSMETGFSSDEQSTNFPWMVTSSESEFSDTEGGQHAYLKSLQIKIRLHAFNTLLTVIKVTEKLLIFGYWSNFLPDTPSPSNDSLMQSRTILYCIMKDSSPKVRYAAVSVVCSLIGQAKQFLFLADDSQSHRTAFMSFSILVANMIKELHRFLVLAVIAETCSMTLTQLVKCLALLVAATPYHKLKPGLLSKVVRNVRPLLSHRIHSVQVASLSVMAAVISRNPPLDEISKLMYSSSDDGTDEHERTGEKIWLFDACISNVMIETEGGRKARADVALPIRLESLQLLSLFVECQLKKIRNYIDLLTELIDGCLLDSDYGVQLHGTKLLKSIANSLLQELSDGNEEGELLANQALQFWIKCLSGPLPGMLQNVDQKSLQAVGCDCLANISPLVFEKLPIGKRVLCLTLTLGLTHDSDKKLKASAIRALGMFVAFPILRKDPLFLADVSDIVISSMHDDNLAVCIKTAWTLANLTDALLHYKENIDNEDISFEALFPFEQVHNLFKVCLDSNKDSDKVKYNTVRAIGNLLRLIPLSFIDECETRKDTVFKCFDSLAECVLAGLDKTRWNACNSAGNFFQNQQLLEKCPLQFEKIFSALVKMLSSCPNYKVRINAASALSILSCRSHFGFDVGNKYMELIHCLLNSLDTLEDISDFSEFKHMEALRNQIIRCFLHLLSLAQEPDIEAILKCIQHKTSQVRDGLIKFKNCSAVGNTDEYIHKAKTNIETISNRTTQESAASSLIMLLKEDLNFAEHAAGVPLT